ncbi:hypothetical protein [Streptomyces sp. NPDC057677]|uniref:hypothetical protein n=1 Tax=unclassified Streptomyces TaxID=2593676 RepID=UPI0036B75A09
MNDDASLHARRAHPDWEYATTEGPRKQWGDVNQPPLDDNGDPDPTWERNLDAGHPGEGWERFDYTEESYWRRPKKRAARPEPEGTDETPLEAACASIDLRDAVIDQLKIRAEIAENKARELEGATDIAVRAVQLMQQAGAERDAARARLAAFADQVQTITDEARGGIRQQLGDALAALDEQPTA